MKVPKQNTQRGIGTEEKLICQKCKDRKLFLSEKTDCFPTKTQLQGERENGVDGRQGKQDRLDNEVDGGQMVDIVNKVDWKMRQMMNRANEVDGQNTVDWQMSICYMGTM